MPTPLHPALVHLPLALAVILPFLSIGGLVALWRHPLGRTARAVVTAFQLALVGSGLVALQTGKGDEERVERVVGEAAIERHEERAEQFLVLGGVAAAVALAGLFLRRRTPQLGAAGLTTALTLVVAVAAVRVGDAGGDIVYRHGGAAVWKAGAAPIGPSTAIGEDDGDDE